MLTLKRRQNEWRRAPAPQERLHRESEHARRSLREVGDALQRVRSLRKRRLVHSRYRPALPDGHGLVPQLESGCYALSLTQQTEANMSLLTATHEDFEARNGAPLPAGVYRVLVEQAGTEGSQKGTQFKRMYGQIRTRDGATEIPAANGGGTFRIGNRKLFARSWIEHSNPKAQA